MSVNKLLSHACSTARGFFLLLFLFFFIFYSEDSALPLKIAWVSWLTVQRGEVDMF